MLMMMLADLCIELALSLLYGTLRRLQLLNGGGELSRVRFLLGVADRHLGILRNLNGFLGIIDDMTKRHLMLVYLCHRTHFLSVEVFEVSTLRCSETPV